MIHAYTSWYQILLASSAKPSRFPTCKELPVDTRRNHIPNISKTQFEGLSTEVQYRLIERSASNPFAFAVAVEPFRSWIDFATGQRADSYGAAFKLLADAVVVPDKVFWAVNAICA